MTPAETMKLRTMPTCTTCRDGVIGPHAHGNVGEAGSGQRMTRGGVERWASRPGKRGGACGGGAGCGGEWAAKTVKRPPQQPVQPPVRQLPGPANAKATPPEIPAAAADRTQRPASARKGKNG